MFPLNCSLSGTCFIRMHCADHLISCTKRRACIETRPGSAQGRFMLAFSSTLDAVRCCHATQAQVGSSSLTGSLLMLSLRCRRPYSLI